MSDVRTYAFVLAALIVLTVVTVAVSQVDLGALNLAVALAVATTKVVVVGTWFMHLRVASRLTLGFALTGFVWLVVMVALTLADVETRDSGAVLLAR